ncbi:MAG: sulfite exporter TauE/SafE family protein [Pseudomonadota bacterium]|nr:sulfite exporter TauE/SafE family protein [Pseudomonadota bacterium]
MEFDASLSILVITLAAFLASMVTAVVGAGGGTALLLLMLYMIPAGNVVAVHGCIQLVSNFARVVLFWRHMHWPVIVRFVIPMPAGVYLGLHIYEMMDQDSLQLVIASFVLLSLVIRPSSSPKATGVPKAVYYATGFFIGAANIIVGVLSPILGAILRLERLPKEHLVGTLGFFGFAGNVFKIAGFAFVGFSFAPYAAMVVCASLATIAGTYAGKRLLAGISSRTFTVAFQIMLGAMAARLIWTAF